MHETNADVVILGGGLAGLCLALQLRTRFAELSIRVLERSAHPPRVSAHKVGESSVEINAHYLSHTLGLRAHLDEQHVRKFGFRFFFSDARSDIGNVTELGVSEVLPTPTWQIESVPRRRSASARYRIQRRDHGSWRRSRRTWCGSRRTVSPARR